MDRSDMWTPESPFLESPYFQETESEDAREAMSEVVAPWAQAEGPFARDESSIGQPQLEAAEVVSELLAELEDEGFTADIYEMAAEAQEVISRSGADSYISSEAAQLEGERQLEQHFAPLIAEAERMHAAVGEGFSHYDVTYASEAELESLVAQFVPALGTSLTPVQEQFLGKLIKKVGSAVKGAVQFVKKGVQTVGKGLAAVGRTVLMPLLRKLSKLVRPLLKRVIQFAMGKLPAAVRPIAQKLADKLFGSSQEFAFEEPARQLVNAPSAHNVQMEYNFLVAEAVISGESSEAEDEAFAGAMIPGEASDMAGKLHEATQQLAESLASLGEGEDPRPALQQFLPAALLALKPIVKGVVSIIGRDKIVNFIADLIAKLISRWIGPEQAKMLAQPIVSVGLGLLGLETAAQSEEPRVYAAEVLAQTVQETVLNLVQQPASVFEQQNLLQSVTMESFEAAARTNFPSEAMRPELRETSEGGGQWVLLPRGAKRKAYKKYSQIFDVTLDPRALKRVKTFADVPLADMLESVSGLSFARTVKAKIHLYELNIGARLVDVSRLETNVGGLGSYNWPSWRRLMPLTSQAASELLPKGAAGLGKDPGQNFLQGPYLTSPGQRFYHIELPGERPAVKPSAAGIGGNPLGASATVSGFNDVGIVINLIRGAITVKIRLSETKAQEMATYLRRRDFATPIQIMRSIFGGLEGLRQGRLTAGVRIEGETMVLQEYLTAAVEGENFLPAAAGAALAKIGQELLAKLASKLFDALWNAVAQYFANKSAEFIAATENPAQGVTILLAFNGIDSLKRYRDIRDGRLSAGIGGFIADRLKTLALPVTALPIPSLAVRPGML
jgi:hypothetical protein